MAEKERLREVLRQPLTQDYLEERLAEGWKPAVVEWEREIAAGEGSGRAPQMKTEVPYGLRVSDDCHTLEADHGEQEVMTAMLQLIVDDRPLSEVAAELNRRGYRTRSGRAWTQTSLFNLLPRLTEAAPDIFATEGWSELRRQRFLEVATAS